MTETHVEPLLTVGDVAGLFDVTPSTVRRWVKYGHLVALKLPGGQIKFAKSVVDEALARTTGGPLCDCGKPLGTHPTIDAVSGESWCSDDCRDSAGQAMAEFQAS